VAAYVRDASVCDSGDGSCFRRISPKPASPLKAIPAFRKSGSVVRFAVDLARNTVSVWTPDAAVPDMFTDVDNLAQYHAYVVTQNDATLMA
jgi:hypothetical protein